MAHASPSPLPSSSTADLHIPTNAWRNRSDGAPPTIMTDARELLDSSSLLRLRQLNFNYVEKMVILTILTTSITQVRVTSHSLIYCTAASAFAVLPLYWGIALIFAKCTSWTEGARRCLLFFIFFLIAATQAINFMS